MRFQSLLPKDTNVELSESCEKLTSESLTIGFNSSKIL